MTIHTNDETEKASIRSAYQAGKLAVLDMPPWKFFLLIILALVIGVTVEKWLVSRYALLEFTAFLLSLVAVVLFGCLAKLVMKFGRRRHAS
jgi:hypothetical protein